MYWIQTSLLVLSGLLPPPGMFPNCRRILDAKAGAPHTLWARCCVEEEML
jgi:hypothetical protein